MEDEETGDLFIPCRMCCQKCFKIHGKHHYHEKERSNGCVSFFKVMLGDYKERLSIPPIFASQIVNEWGEHIMLQGPSGQEWTVQLLGSNHKLEFRHGWENFVNYHVLQLGDFAVFRHISKLCFEVEIFGKNGCVKEISDLQLEKTNIGADQRCPTPPNLLIDLVFDEETNYTAETTAAKQRRKRKSCFAGHSFKKNMAMDSAAPFESDKPFDKIIMKPWNVNKPYKLEFRKLWKNSIQLPKEKSEVVLLVGEGKEWKVKCFMRKDIPTFSGGWRFFTRGNNIKEGDICIFEQLNNRQNEFVFRVHIFPHAKKDNLQQRNQLEKTNIGADQRCPPPPKLLIDLVSDEETDYTAETTAGKQRRKKKSCFAGHSIKKHVMDSAAPFKSDKPFYKILMKSWNVNEPHMLEFTKLWGNSIQLPKKKSEVVLLVGEGMEWKVQCIIKNNFPAFSAGWRFFTRGNNIKEGDICIFEQLNSQNEFVFRVHIFPHAKKDNHQQIDEEKQARDEECNFEVNKL